MFGKRSKTPTHIGAGTVYFTSIRPQEQGAWRIGKYILATFLLSPKPAFQLTPDTSPIQGYRRRRASDQAGRPSNQAGAKRCKIMRRPKKCTNPCIFSIILVFFFFFFHSLTLPNMPTLPAITSRSLILSSLAISLLINLTITSTCSAISNSFPSFNPSPSG